MFGLKSHPKALQYLFFAEMWERFSYYGMRALLILFMVKHFLFADEKAYYIFAAYGALVYSMPFIGGLLADKLLGYRKSVVFGAVMMTLGHFAMAGPDLFDGQLGEALFYIALAFIIVGNGFFKPNISSIVGSLYPDGDNRRDSGFTIFYMGINLGAFLAPLVCGTVGELYSWSLGFGLAGVGMILGLVVFLRAQKYLDGRGNPPNEVLILKRIVGLSIENWVYVLGLVLVPILAILVYYYTIASNVLYIFGGIALVYILFLAFKSAKVDRERLFVVLVMIVFSALFWAFFEQAASSINMFTDRNVARLGIPTSVFQSVNPLFILLFASLFSSLWITLANKNKQISTPVKFALAIMQLGIGFFMLVIGGLFANEEGMVSLLWLLLGYLFITTGELCLSPVGLSMVTKLAPKRIVAVVMGGWLLSSAFAHNLGGLVASFTSTSQYNVPSMTYEPAIGFQGVDTFSYRVSQKVYVGVKGDTLLVEPRDTTSYTLVQLNSDTVQVAVHVLKNETLLPVKHITSEIENVDSLLEVERSNTSYQPMKVTHHQVDMFVARRTAIAESSIKINGLDYMLGNKNNMQLEIVTKPSSDKGRVTLSSNLHSLVTPQKTVGIYTHVFLYIGLASIGAGVVLLLLVPLLKRWMHGVN